MTRESDRLAELRRLLEALCEGTITAEQMEKLGDSILTDPEAEAFYIKYMHLQAGLRQFWGLLVEPGEEAKGKAPQVVAAGPGVTVERTESVGSPSAGRLAAPWRRRLPWIAAAAIVLALPPRQLLLIACVGVVVVTLGSGGLTQLHYYTTIKVGQNMVNDLRGALYAHLQRQSLAYHGRQRVGDLMYRITADSFAVQTMIMNGLLPILSAVILLAGMMVVLLPLDPVLTLLALTVVPVPISA